MGERDEAYAELAEAGVVDAVRWAAMSAYRRAFEDHDEDAGYNQGSYGYGATTLLEDRLDRVFATGRYVEPEDDDGVEAIAAGLDPRDVGAMPRLPSGQVRRDDLNGSPGWRCGRWRVLLIKTPYGHVDGVHWTAKSQTRQEVAARPQPDQLVLALPGGADNDADDGDPTTLMVAHSGDRYSGARELYLARPRYNRGGGAPWHWRVDLSEATAGRAAPPTTATAGDQGGAAVAAGDRADAPAAAGDRRDVAASAGDRDDVPDARVRLRDIPGREGSGSA